jgi:hypothetical protein
MPIHCYQSDDLIQQIKNYKFETPYAMFTNQSDTLITNNPCLWTRKDRVAIKCTQSGATTLVPRDIKADLVSQIYDYPYLETSKIGITETDLDIIYISNGEPDEERWYNHLVRITSQNYSYAYENRVKWIRGVNGRVAAYQAAAQASTTPWFFAVFAKLEVDEMFNWHWQPDYWQGAKHYIFNSHNPVNGLQYGHQGMIAYNRRLVLENNTPGIDFTLSQPHESIPIVSGVAHFNQDAWMTWRTAFREVVKLKMFMDTQPTLETEHRLQTWLTQAKGAFAQDCLRGAHDALQFYNSVSGDPVELQKSFEWAWLRAHYDK